MSLMTCTIFQYFSADQILTHENRRTWTRMGERIDLCEVLLGKIEGKRTLGRSRRTLVFNINIRLQEVGCGIVNCLELAQDCDRWRVLLKAVMKLWVP